MKKRELSHDDVLSVVSTTYSLPVALLMEHKRSALNGADEARQVAMFLCREMLHLTLVKTGALFGRKHPAVIAACQAVQSRKVSDATFARLLTSMQQQLVPSMPTIELEQEIVKQARAS